MFPPPFDLTGRVAVVTGAGGGLGAAFCRILGDAGAVVVCVDRDDSSAHALAGELGQSGTTAHAATVDVTHEGAVGAMIDDVVERFGKIDILVNNAGIGEIRSVPLHRVRVEHWRSVLSVDLDGVFLCSRATLAYMQRQGSGKIINVASMYGLRGSSSSPISAYAAAKGAVVNMTREVALQYAAHGVQINALCPGFVRTGLGEGAYSNPEFVAALEKQVPCGRIASPMEMQGALLMLASSASDYMTGQTVVVDGGISAG